MSRLKGNKFDYNFQYMFMINFVSAFMEQFMITSIATIGSKYFSLVAIKISIFHFILMLRTTNTKYIIL